MTAEIVHTADTRELTHTGRPGVGSTRDRPRRVPDDGADPDVERLARELGVRYPTRRGVPRYNELGPSFQAKTKADKRARRDFDPST